MVLRITSRGKYSSIYHSHGYQTAFNYLLSPTHSATMEGGAIFVVSLEQLGLGHNNRFFHLVGSSVLTRDL